MWKTQPIEKSPLAELEASGFTRPLLDINATAEERRFLDYCGQQIQFTNTAENISKELNDYGIAYICLYPILPNTSLEEYLAAAKLFDKRFLPFTSADFSLPIDKMVEKLEKDIQAGAYGLKIHPVLQNIYLSDPRAEAAIEVFGKAGKPVVSHCGANDYYQRDADFPRNPDAGNTKYFIEMANKFPQYTLIADARRRFDGF